VTAVAGKVILYAVLMGSGVVAYIVARKIGFTIDQSLVIALISVVCMIGSWHP